MGGRGYGSNGEEGCLTESVCLARLQPSLYFEEFIEVVQREIVICTLSGRY